MSWVTFRYENSEPDRSVEAAIQDLWHEYLIEHLGIPASLAQARIKAEINGNLHLELLNTLENQGWSFRDANVLDLGCGTGALGSALIDRGARIIGIEPSPAWAIVAHKRLRERNPSYGQIINGVGQKIPLQNNSVDYVMSLQVLEHVPMLIAQNIIGEIARVLRPEGKAYLAFENYCSFFEPHYRVRWFPYLPKRIGAIYLRFLGRDPYFLFRHIYYNSSVLLAVTCLSNELKKHPWTILQEKLEKPDKVIGFLNRQAARVLSLLPASWRNILIVAYLERSQLFKTTFHLELTHG